MTARRARSVGVVGLTSIVYRLLRDGLPVLADYDRRTRCVIYRLRRERMPKDPTIYPAAKRIAAMLHARGIALGPTLTVATCERVAMENGHGRNTSAYAMLRAPDAPVRFARENL